MKFTIGSSYNVFEAKGLSFDRQNRLSISERLTGEVITPAIELVYLGKKGVDVQFDGVHAFQLPDGRLVKGHANHFDATAPYNAAKAAKATPATPPAPVQLQEPEIEIDSADIQLEA